MKEIFVGSENPMSYFGDRKPILVTKKEDPSIAIGDGILNLYYRGINVSGIAESPTQL